LKSRAPRGGACGGEGAPRHLEASLALRSIWDGGFGLQGIRERGRELMREREGEGELVSEREGERESEL